MPDEKGQTEADEKDVPETTLHAHGSAVEDDPDRPRDDEHKGELLDDEQDDAAEARTPAARPRAVRRARMPARTPRRSERERRRTDELA